MAKSKAANGDRKGKKKLRRTWIDEHPDVRAAQAAIDQAERDARQPKWVADPNAYCNSARDAGVRVGEVKAKLKEVVARLKGEFDKAVGLEDGTGG